MNLASCSSTIQLSTAPSAIQMTSQRQQGNAEWFVVAMDGYPYHLERYSIFSTIILRVNWVITQCGDVLLPDEFPHCWQRGFYCYNDDPSPFIRDSERIIDDSFCADITPLVSSVLYHYNTIMHALWPFPNIGLGSCNGGRCFNGIWIAFPWTEVCELTSKMSSHIYIHKHI